MTNTEAGEEREFPDPEGATTPAEFVTAMRRLRSWSGLTYRQVETRASANGDVLPYSTLATALRRDTMPRRELTGAFVRACGGNPDEVTRWLSRHDRLSAAREHPVRADEPAAESAAGVAGSGPGSISVAERPAPLPDPRPRRGPRPIAAAAGAVALGGFVLFLLFGEQIVRPPNMHWKTIRTQHDTCLDITGKDERGNPVVVEEPCQADPAQEQRFAQVEVDGHYRLKVYNPEVNNQTWCVDVDPRQRLRIAGCVPTSRSQLFRIEQAGGYWRLAPLDRDRCFGLVAPERGARREVHALECADSPSQLFRIDPA